MEEYPEKFQVVVLWAGVAFWRKTVIIMQLRFL